MKQETHQDTVIVKEYFFDPFGTIFGWLRGKRCHNHHQPWEKEVMIKLAELATALGAVNDQLEKAKTEILAKIAELQDALANIEVPADAQAALDTLVAKAQALDDIVVDAAPPVEEVFFPPAAPSA